MNSYRIAIIVAGIDQTYQSSILSGIQSVASECSLDFYVFASFSGIMDNVSHDAGELNIFNLPDFNDFDGAVLLTNTIDYQYAVDDILERIKSAGIPAVCIDNDAEGLFHIGIDNKTAMREITEHFIKVHGFTKFNYISGPKNNSESIDRLEAFLEVLRENGLTIDENRIYYGDFRAPSGKAAVEYFRKNTPYMPEAIICANDVMAAAAINRLYEDGFKVPSEIAVSGFDNTFNNHNLRIELTSVQRPLALSGQLAAKMLYNHFRGIAQQRSVILNMSTRFTESCGCHDSVIQDYKGYKELNITNYSRVESYNTYMTLFNQLSCKLHGFSNFEDYITCLKKFVADIDPEEFYFCLCDNWRSELIDSNGIIKENEFLHTDYTTNMLVPIAYYHGKFYDVDSISRRMLIPDVSGDKSKGKFYYFLPLHFGERCLGYMAIRNCKVSLHNAMFQSWCITINNSLENIRKLLCLNYAINRLENLYTQDTFSGIYNRNGFVKATSDIFRDCAENHRNIMLMFIDLDGLKVINDTYGHETGDTAIRSIADVLCRACGKDEIFCRFGGDEFIVFAPDYTEKDAEALTRRIDDNIAEKNRTSCHEFMLSASMGYIITVPEKDEDLFKFVTEADKIMYETKRKKKLSNYLKS
ncbi:MAG: GGDEF domain-containing protein [Ruminococcus flavefaciens]|nr:GGDEF domain-containing protein [Ruminococcus flavefaciens]MCM1229657.1 GGDEF domain-containing protein [Ruminococcus flavefaciens]